MSLKNNTRMRYLFDHRKQLQSRLAKRKIFLFLDYDGTLSPIVSHPKKAKISKKCKKLLKRLSLRQKVCLAVISGRSLKDLRIRVGVKSIIYSGNHGLEVSGVKLKPANNLSAEYKRTLKQIKRDLNKRLRQFKGAIVEDKGLTLSIHYRMTPDSKLSGLKAAFRRTVRGALAGNLIKVRGGKKVFEVRPPIEWDKGKIVSWLLKKNKLKGATPIYIGDDKTDEDAFRVLKRRGITIFVGEPKKSSAQYYLKNTFEVIRFLQLLLNLMAG